MKPFIGRKMKEEVIVEEYSDDMNLKPLKDLKLSNLA